MYHKTKVTALMGYMQEKTFALQKEQMHEPHPGCIAYSKRHYYND